MATQPFSQQQTLEEWLDTLRQLFAQTSDWISAQNWWFEEDTKTIRENELGTYDAPVFRIRTQTSRLVLEPVARYVIGADGRVDLEAWPSLNRIKLIRRKGEWQIMTD